VTPRQKKIEDAISQLAIACGYVNDDGIHVSESKTEAFFKVLDDAMIKVCNNWDATVERSHKQGLCYNVFALLGDALMEAIAETEPVH